MSSPESLEKTTNSIEEIGSEIAATDKRKKRFTCKICGEKIAVLGDHVFGEHGLKLSEYCEQTASPPDSPIVPKNESELREQVAVQAEISANLQRARRSRERGKKPVG